VRPDIASDLPQLVAAFILTVAFVGAFMWWTRRSLLRLLPTLPDFEGKERLVEAGHRDWAYACVLVALYICAPAMPFFLPARGFATMVAMKALALLAFAASFLCRSRDSILAGNLLGAASPTMRLFKRPFDLDQWLSRRDRVVRRYRLAAIPFGILALVWAAMLPSMYWADRMQVEVAASQALGITLSQQLAGPEVDKVFPLTPPPAMRPCALLLASETRRGLAPHRRQVRLRSYPPCTPET
jgi:hypothetical protein